MTYLQSNRINVKLPGAMAAALLAGTLSLAAPTHAEIYESESSDGTPTFSDTPAPGSHEVQLPEGNVADPFESIPALESDAEPAPRPSNPGPADGKNNAGTPGPDYWPTYADDESGETRKEVLNAEARDEVLNADERVEVLDADERREVGEATPRHEVQRADPRDEVLNAGQRREVGHEP